MHILGTHHVAIHTANLERLRAFYVETLGLAVVGGWPAHRILFVGVGTTIEIIEDGRAITGDGRERSGWNHLAWEVEDLSAAYTELTARGVAFHVPPEPFPPDAPAYRIAFFTDPDGNVLEVVERT